MVESVHAASEVILHTIYYKYYILQIGSISATTY